MLSWAYMRAHVNPRSHMVWRPGWDLFMTSRASKSQIIRATSRGSPRQSHDQKLVVDRRRCMVHRSYIVVRLSHDQSRAVFRDHGWLSSRTTWPPTSRATTTTGRLTSLVARSIVRLNDWCCNLLWLPKTSLRWII